jgi:broad specificity phosphatase PhoE
MRLMLVRHAEKPDESADGVTPDGASDEESLIVRGWQRAGALAQFFRVRSEYTPRVIFAAGTGHKSNSKRPMQTVTPLAALLKHDQGFEFITKYLKDDLQDPIDNVLPRQGPVLIAWEHKLIPALIGLLPNAPKVPDAWPDDRFDMVWVLDRMASGWTFSQVPQLLLAGDSSDPIA